MKYKSTAIAAAILFTMASQSFAATVVKVVEGGEAGGPMTLTLDRSTIKAGETIFRVHNDAVAEEHEMVLVKLKSPDQKIDVVAGKNRIDEKKLKSMGEVSDLKPGADGQLKAKLTPGFYVLLCNIKGHYQAGMHAGLTVTS
ncbi:hypothetical protein [Rhizobium sp. Leaf262]|uniref:hypothetical protein n=1 Tax=Rhizobium sp. Leaf262 TaxID=1736312 RepID=UPI000716245A|nr:hypothetical protein [Rhizobium sp. Leaf262]KQO75754.1 copper resistance protein [Rhizobium sp. Leaf262]